MGHANPGAPERHEQWRGWAACWEPLRILAEGDLVGYVGTVHSPCQEIWGGENTRKQRAEWRRAGDRRAESRLVEPRCEDRVGGQEGVALADPASQGLAVVPITPACFILFYFLSIFY